MKSEFFASMMCANFAHLENEVKSLENAGISGFHIDIMDGAFVDNFGMGYQDMKFIKENAKTPVEVHLMVKEPLNYLPLLFALKIDIIYIHPEVCADSATMIEKIQKAGAMAGIALNPGTSISGVEELLNVVNKVLILGVNPGHSGRAYQPFVDKKIEKLLNLQTNYDFQLHLDGAVSPERIKQWQGRVKGFVLGTATLFNKSKNYAEILENLRKI